MGCNFYARIKPSKEAKEALKGAIDIDFYQAIEDCYKEMYSSLEYDYADEMFKGGYIHLGKASGGWKFLWNPNWSFILTQINPIGIPNKWKMVSFYPLTKKGIKDFIDREDVEIYDEYGKKQNKEKFWQMALTWCTDGLDGDTSKCDPYKPDDYDRIVSAGIKLTNYHDFYSDGLRFSTSTEFC